VNHYRHDSITIIDCNTFNYLPDTCCRKFRMWLFLFFLILFSPLIVIFLMVVEFFKFTNIGKLAYFSESYNTLCCVLVNILCLPWNILILSIGFVLALAFGTVVMVFVVPVFIYRNCKQFNIIMRYWSRKNRFRGDEPVKVDLIEAAKK
jgi:hypothetical protein